MDGESKIILPKKDENGKPYISYSQYNTWKTSKREYIRQYFYGEKFISNEYIEFGSKVGTALENNDYSGFTDREQEFLKTIPRYDEFERKVSLDMGDYSVIGYIDTNKKPVSCIADYKTGEIIKKQSEYASDDYIQLDIYAGAIEQETGVLPEEVYVHLIDRKGNAFKGEKLTLGCSFVTITKNVNKERIEKVKSDIDKIVREISSYYKVFLKLQSIT